MKWNDVELVDGKFYVVEVERWLDGRRNEWLFAYKENENFFTESYVRCAMFRAKFKAQTGKTYRNEREAERQRAYSAKYQKEHKTDPKFIETKRKCSRNANERRKIKNEVEILSEFFMNEDF